MAKNTAFIPIRIDAVFLEEDSACIKSRLDFSKLPYNNGSRDIHFDTPYLGESITSPPFSYRNAPLKKGVHIHWVLPDALTRKMRHQLIEKTLSNRLNYPSVPNRWIVSRYREGVTEPEKQWMVESDYLYPVGQGKWEDSIAYPMKSNQEGQAPFQFMGRSYPFPDDRNDPRVTSPDDKFLEEPLTALGYGDLTFAALYPNCTSVFGFHDSSIESSDELQGLTYEVIGYYKDTFEQGTSKKDYLTLYLNHSINKTPTPENSVIFNQLMADMKLFFSIEVPASTFTSDIREVLLADKWIATKTIQDTDKDFLQPASYNSSIAINAILEKEEDSIRQTINNLLKAHLPEQMICFGAVASIQKPPAQLTEADLHISIGNTGTEALSAYLANQMRKDPSDVHILEEYLESLHLSHDLEHLHVDIDAAFKAGRHAKGFKSIHGGSRWVIREVHSFDANGIGREPYVEDRFAHLLNELNLLQQDVDRLNRNIKSQKMQLYADWKKYMHCRYMPIDEIGKYPSPEEVRFFIEKIDIDPLEKLEKQWADAVKRRDETKNHLIAQLFTLQYFKIEDVLDWQDFLKSGLGNVEGIGDTAATLSIRDKQRMIDALNRQMDDVTLTQEMLDQMLNSDTVWPEEIKQILEKGMDHLLPNEKLRLMRLMFEQIASGDFVLRSNYEVQSIPDLPFSQPSDPVVMIAGDKIKSSDRHGRDDDQKADGLLECPLFLVDLEPLNYTAIHENILTFKKNLTEEHFAFSNGDNLRRRPMLMDWQVEFYPAVNHSSEENIYSSSYLIDSYQLVNNKMDWSVIESAEDPYHSTGHNYWGTTILSAHPGKQLKQSIELFLENQLSQEDSMVKLAHDVLDEISKNNFLSQSLGGFTSSLLMHTTGYQLEIKEPLGFDDDQAFTEKVKNFLGPLNHSNVMPTNAFLPVRAGGMNLLELRLIDHFGLEMIHLKELSERADINSSETLQTDHVSASGFHATLPPRLAQPARLDFRWLSADDNDLEFNYHPATSPICGWIIVNDLDQSLLVYNQSGKALGYLDREATWRPFPGHAGLIIPESIANSHLRQMVLRLIAQAKPEQKSKIKQQSIPDFLAKINKGLGTIEPDTHPSHSGISILMSQPLALVRASVGIELYGLPAVQQGWNELRQEMNVAIQPDGSIKRETKDVENISFTIRLGEDQQLNDGLVGFWIHDSVDGRLEEMFHAPVHRLASTQSSIEDEGILHNIKLNPSPSDQVHLSILMDPRGALHATTGLLPVSKLKLPPDLYTHTLRGMEAIFLTAPILSPKTNLSLSLPDEPGYAWSWIGKEPTFWKETNVDGIVQKEVLEEEFNEQSAGMWDFMLQNDFIRPIGVNKASIVPKGHRGNSPDMNKLKNELKGLLEQEEASRSDDNKNRIKFLQSLIGQIQQIEEFLNRQKILPFNVDAHFAGPQYIREGWLKLQASTPIEDKS